MNKLREKIIRLLDDPTINNENEFKTYVTRVQKLIFQYERSLYNDYTDENKEEIRSFRKNLSSIITFYKKESLFKNNEEPKFSSKAKDGLSTLKLLNVQLATAKVNKNLLEKGTLKLVGLNYTSKDIKEGIIGANKKLKNLNIQEKNEIKRLRIVFTVFLLITFLIIIDKLYLKFRVTELMKEVPEVNERRSSIL
ncbi:hypothetical protein A0H76_2193 [Hepatospora eriocheir]|uniref:Uncharacterized protein n=1 Tax=Hepatospora eriocheir TaxID=1081669 RepID=A0A1X0QLJ4_9MICR|nr:hypothetical protein A0H76_2193 [Hepatospora eriocheir]